MHQQVGHTADNKSNANAHNLSSLPGEGESLLQFEDNRPEAIAQRKLQAAANNSPAVQYFNTIQQMANNSQQVRQLKAVQAMVSEVPVKSIDPIRQRKNDTGMPDNLKSGVENLSGVSMEDVKVHYNSDKPAQLQAHAFAQGTDIHIAPGQEQHLAHEAWHVVQQKQGRVQSDGNLPVQLVRAKLASPSDGIDLARLEAMLVAIDAEIVQLTADCEEVVGVFIEPDMLARVAIWRGQYNDLLTELRGREPGAQSFTIDQIRGRTDALTENIYGLCARWVNIARELNESLKALNDKKEQDEALAAGEDYEYEPYTGPKKEKPVKEKEKPTATPTRGGPVGLGTKWGKHRDLLAFDGQLKYVQFVPEGAPSIERCIASQKITDAVYNPSKAFWISNEKKYTIASAGGKTKMIYTFTGAGAKSLVEDYLICGSGDYSEDNEEEWTGETAHPNYTIWKTNEIGAYGVGNARLAALEQYCIKIEAE
jgi:hypothetical protein